MGERVHRSVMNIKVGIFFYVISLFLAFFSRKIFLDCLGAEFIGLTGMLMNIMSFLSVAELGIGTSIVYFLYKPLQEDDHEKINEIMSMLAYLYRCIGLIIGLGGLYKQLLVGANQKQYLVNAYFQTIGIVQSITQIILAYSYRNLYLWVAVGIVFTIIGIIVFNIRIRQLYPWLHIDLQQGRKNLHNYPEILKKTRQIFVQKIKDFILYRSDEILVGAFVSVVQVAFYGNYTIITSKLNFLVNILSDGMAAGVGNLIAEGNQQNTMKVFWELTAIRFFIAGFVVFGLLLFTQPFISFWFGESYLLSDIIVYLIVFNIFVYLSRGVVEMYIGACGLFSDVWAAWTELFLNITITLCLAPSYGIIGILLGKIISVFFIAVFWKPYFLFSQGFRLSVSIYWKGMVPYYTIIGAFVTLLIFVRHYIPYFTNPSAFYQFLTAAIFFVILIVGYFFAMLFTTKGTKYFLARFHKNQ